MPHILHLLPIAKTLEANQRFAGNEEWQENLERSITFFEGVGYKKPWHGYYAEKDGDLVASCGFKGPPTNGKVEIAYVVSERFRNLGIGTQVCRMLVELAQETDPAIGITASTLPKNVASAKILIRNGFERTGSFEDEKDGEVWEWELKCYC